MAKPSGEIKAAVEFATAGDVAALRSVLERSPEAVESPQVLNAAALQGKTACVELLLAQGADPNGIVPSHEQYRPLHRAIEHRGVVKNPGHLETARLLIDGAASLTARATWRGLKPVQVAAMMGDEEFLALVLDPSGELDFYSLVILADHQQVREQLVANPSIANLVDDNGMRPLHYAALSGLSGLEEQGRLAAIAAALLEAGAEPNAKEKIGPYEAIVPLHFAVGANNFAVARTLLEGGADPNGGLGSGLWHGDFRMAELCLSFGGDVNGLDSPGTPLLHSRLHWNLPTVVLWMLERGADPNLKDGRGNTGLHAAAKRGSNPKVLEALLAAGAEVGAVNLAGETALEVARANGKEKVVGVLEGK